MRRSVVGVLMGLLCLAVLWSPVAAYATETPASVSIQLAPANGTDEYEPGRSHQFELVATNVSDRIGSYDLTISSSNRSVATLASYTPADERDSFVSVSFSEENASLRVVQAGAELAAEKGGVTIGTVSVKTNGTGTGTLSVDVTDLTNASGVSYTVGSTENVTVLVRDQVNSSMPPFPGFDDPPTNTDDDEQLEDINGDGKLNIFDALAYYNNRDSDAVQDNPHLFDFDGDGTSGDLFDALALYNEIS